jgi:hypothetical protein
MKLVGKSKIIVQEILKDYKVLVSEHKLIFIKSGKLFNKEIIFLEFDEQEKVISQYQLRVFDVFNWFSTCTFDSLVRSLRQ